MFIFCVVLLDTATGLIIFECVVATVMCRPCGQLVLFFVVFADYLHAF